MANGTSGTSSQQMVSAQDYILNLSERINTVSTSIQQALTKQSNLDADQQILQDQLNRVTKVLNYLTKLDPQLAELDLSLNGLYSFFDVRKPQDLSPAQVDLKPADVSLALITSMVNAIGTRLYFAIVNTNIVANAVEETYNDLIKNTKHDPDPDSSSNPYGQVTVDIQPQDDLVNKLKTAKDAGIAALEKLANTFLEYINYLQAVEELRGLAGYLTTGLLEEIKALNLLAARITNRERIAIGEKKHYEKDYIAVHTQYEAISLQLKLMEQDYKLLKAEFDAAQASMRPGSPVPNTK